MLLIITAGQGGNFSIAENVWLRLHYGCNPLRSTLDPCWLCGSTGRQQDVHAYAADVRHGGLSHACRPYHVSGQLYHSVDCCIKKKKHRMDSKWRKGTLVWKGSVHLLQWNSKMPSVLLGSFSLTWSFSCCFLSLLRAACTEGCLISLWLLDKYPCFYYITWGLCCIFHCLPALQNNSASCYLVSAVSVANCDWRGDPGGTPVVWLSGTRVKCSFLFFPNLRIKYLVSFLHVLIWLIKVSLWLMTYDFLPSTPVLCSCKIITGSSSFGATRYSCILVDAEWNQINGLNGRVHYDV